MINQIKFKSLIKDLGMMFVPLDEGQIDIYYDRLKNFDDRILEEAVKYLYDTHTYKRFPMIAEIRDAAFQAMRELPEPMINEIEDEFECEVCHGVGRIVDEITENGGYFHSAEKFCVCPKGQRDKASRAEWKRNQRRKGI